VDRRGVGVATDGALRQAPRRLLGQAVIRFPIDDADQAHRFA